MIIRIYEIGGLKAQQANSIGHRPMYPEVDLFALKGQKHLFMLELLPLQGVSYPSNSPMAMPWAISFCPFRALSAEYE